MDKISAELLERIRAAVIKKLREMDRFVDNELPDYIMILVANKRTMSHMQKDLSLFLGKYTIEFTHWLFEMIAHLKKNSTKGTTSLKSVKTEENTEKTNSDEDADVLDYDLEEQEGDLLYQDDNSTSNKPSGSREISKPKPEEEIVKDQSKKPVILKSAKVYPVQPILRLPRNPPLSLVKQTFMADEYDPTKPEYTGSVSSVVHFTRKTSSRPPSLQTNKLLMRAVDDATKSIMNRYKPTPIKMLSTTRQENVGSRSHNLVNIKINPTVDMDTNTSVKLDESSNETSEQETSMSVFELEDSYSVESNTSRTICLASKGPQVCVPDAVVPFNMSQYSIDNAEQEEETTPHFIVTLDGIDLPSLKRKFSDSEESMDIDDNDFLLDDDTDENTYHKKQRINERCKYWPSCKNSDFCEYHHPSVPCKSFPECRFGDKCLYIHPNCKFDSRCSRKACPYTHAMKKKFPPRMAVAKRPQGPRTVCKFYPKCTVRNCAFVHPKLCKFGTKCRSPTCQFTHVSIPPPDQLKWKANTSDAAM